MKITCVFLYTFFILNSFLSRAQSLKDALQGEWLNYKILTNDGVRIDNDSYLRFFFKGTSLFISNNPIDRGSFQSVRYTKDGVNFLEGEAISQQFEARVFQKDSLILITKNESGVPVKYYFVNQNLIEDLTTEPEQRVYEFKVVIFDNPTVFNHLKRYSSYKSTLTNDILPAIKKTSNSFLPPPWFAQDEGKNFRTFFNTEFILKKAYGIDSTDSKFVVDFNVTNNGISNIRIVNKVNYEISSHLFFLLEKSSKHWQLPKNRNLPASLPVRLEFTFIAGEKNDFAFNPKR